MAFQDRESLKRGFGSQPLYLLSAFLFIDLFSRLSPSITLSLFFPSHFSLFFSLFLMFFDKSARGVRRRSSSKGTPWARKRKTSFNPRLSTTTSILCVYRADGLSVLHARVYISCLLQVTSRPPTRDSNFTIDRFSPWPRERNTIEFEATLKCSV